MKRAIVILAALALMLGGVGLADAGPITWSSATNISGDSDVKTDGTAHGALTEGPPGVTDITVNGVSFTASPVGNGSNSLGSSSSPFSGLSSSYQELLSTGSPADLGVVAIDLIIGHRYLIEFWSNDSNTANTLTTTLTDSLGHSVTLSNNTTDAVGGLGQFVVGTFTADATRETVFVTGNGWLNAVQGRDLTLTSVPEPSTLTLLGLGSLSLLGFGWRRRKQVA
jgi:hypothetical protein